MNQVVQRLYQKIAVARTVSLGVDVHIGFGSRIWAPTYLRLGDGVYVGKFCTLECNGDIGTGTMIANNVGIVGRHDHDIQQIGKSVRYSNWVGNHDYLSTSVIIGRDCWIGYGAIVLGSVTIGDSTIVAAGAVVAHDLPENAVCVGNPARMVRKRFTDESFEVHKDRLNRGNSTK